MLASARNICHRLLRWTCSPTCCSAPAPRVPPSRAPRRTATGVSQVPAGGASPSVHVPSRRRGPSVGPRIPRRRTACLCPATWCSSASRRPITWPLPGAPFVPMARHGVPGPASRRSLWVGDPAQPVAATFFCGAYRFEGDLCQGLLAVLPDTLQLRPASGSTLRATMDLLAREMLEDPGSRPSWTGCSTSCWCRSSAITSRPPTATAPRLVPRLRRPADRRCAASPARPAGAPMDGVRARRARPALALGLRTALHGTARGRPAALPGRLAHGAGPRTTARHRRPAGHVSAQRSVTPRSSRSPPRSSATTAPPPAAGATKRPPRRLPAPTTS